MASELLQAIQFLSDDKKIPIDSVIQTIESAIGAAYRKDFGNKLQNIKVDFEMETGNFKVYDVKEVVEDKLKEEYDKLKEKRLKLLELEEQGKLSEKQKKELELQREKKETKDSKNEEEVKRFNPKTMISLSEAKEISKKVKIGEELIQELEVPGEFGRMAAQTAKQVIIQKLREAERNMVLTEYKDKIGELLTGTIQRVEHGVVLVDFGNVTALMPLEEGIRSERYNPGARFKFYVKNVEEGPRGPKVIVSRVHPEILRKLFKLEVPEIASGSVQIKSIAREAGSRSKIAVYAKENNIDPIGSCVGQRGTRVQTIINEIGGEKIDIIEWEEDSAKFIAKALAPAKIIRVEIENNEETNKQSEEANKNKGDTSNLENKKSEEDIRGKGEEKEKLSERQAKVYVLPDQLSLAIGKEGQNVRLAAKLTGWKIDIVEEKLDDDKGEVETTELKKEADEENKKDNKVEEEKKRDKGEEKSQLEEQGASEIEEIKVENGKEK